MGKSAIGRNLLRADAVVDFSALKEAATTSTQTLFNLPAGAIIQDCFVDVVAPLNAASGITNVKLDVGVSADIDAFFNETSMFSGTATAGTRYATEFQNIAGYGNRVRSSATDILGTFEATGANFGDGSTSTLNAGVVRVTVLYRQLPIAGA
tara:strand:+ start:31 stop:486 length:456 start_codon:yes stop_codon:yes gene_type:complete